MIIELEKIGLQNLTRVKCNGRVLETQGLSINDLCDLWKWYYCCPSFDKIYLVTNEDRLYMSLRQRTFASQKSVIELFEEQGVYVKKRSEMNNVKD